MFCRKLKALSAFLLLAIFSNKAFALEEYVSEIYKQIDTCFTAKDETKLNDVLSKNTKDKYYYLIENYTQKRIRRLIVNNDYSFAMDATLALIENNLDNEEAVEMYSVISDAYEIQRKHEAELEHQRQLEIARIEMEKEKQRGNVEKEYVAASKTSGGSVYVTGKETKLTSYNWKASLGMIDLLHLFDKQGGINSLHYGVALDFRYEYTMENKMVIGTDIFAGFQFLGWYDVTDGTEKHLTGNALKVKGEAGNKKIRAKWAYAGEFSIAIKGTPVATPTVKLLREMREKDENADTRQA